MMTKTRLTSILVGALCAMLLAVGCGDSEGEGNNGEDGPTASFTTYNAGLARGFVDYATARQQPVADAVAALDSDVVCMQEVWLYEDEQGNWSEGQIDAIVDTSAETYPNSYYEITEESGGEVANCNDDDTGPIETCVADQCGDVSDDNLAGCALSNCDTEFNNLSSSCQQCIGANIGGSIDDIINACTGEVGGSAYSYNGHNGLLLLSKHEMTNTEIQVLDSEVVQRAVLHATVNVPEFGEADVYCTHLQADLSGSLPYPEDGQYASYEEEQAAQIDAINAYIEQTAQTGNVVLLGDMNNGPAVGNLDASFPDNYAKFTDAGFTNAYLDQSDPECTYCGSNTLVGGDGGSAIDHVLSRFSADVEATSSVRILDETQTITTDEGDLELHLSDHYGVETRFAR
ncbi:MAG: endonuclease/exonuclease/phosphatase family protein [Myxococcota bacterium]